MKQSISSLLLFSLLLFSCQKMTFEEVEADNESGTMCMTFKFGGFSLTGIEEMQPDDVYESRATTSQSNYTDNLLLGIYDMTGNLIDSIQYQKKSETSTNYGTFSHTLKYGKYTILAIGWNGDQVCHVNGLDSIYFSENWVPNTFLARKNIVVDDSYSDTRTITLKRCVAKFMISFKDEIVPDNLKRFTIDISGAGNTLNSENRHCSQIQNFQREVLVDIAPSMVKTLTSYCFLPQDSAGVTVDIVAYDSNGDTISHKNFTNVPMKINYSTNYAGNFYNFASGTESIAFETEFDGEIIHYF